MRKKILAGFLVVAILVTAGIVAVRLNTTEASAAPDAQPNGAIHNDGATALQAHNHESDDKPQAVAPNAVKRGDGGQFGDAPNNSDHEGDDDEAKPFIGIAIIPVEGNEGALIVRVVDGSPADGKLQTGDIITEIDADAIGGPRDVVDYVREQEPGDVIVFEVMRDGEAMDVSVTVGEREDDEYGMRGKGKQGYGDYRGTPMPFGRGFYEDEDKDFDFDLDFFYDGRDEKLILSETRYMTDDGVETTRKAVGTVQNINTTAGTFDLLLLDESETLSFKINDDTKVLIDTEGSIAGLSADEPTLVMDVIDTEGVSDVQLVAQGEFAEIGSKRGFGMMKKGYDDFAPRGFNMERGDGFAPRRFMERFERDGFNPQRFFFGWRSDDDGDGERRGRRSD